MTVPKTIADLYQNVVFAFDMETIYSTGGVTYLRDMGPHQFDFSFPGGAANPTINGDGSMSFALSNYLILPAGQVTRFYSKMPTRELAFLFVGSTNVATTNCLLAAYTTAVNNYGFLAAIDSVTSGLSACKMQLYYGQDTAVVAYCSNNAAMYGKGSRWCSITTGETTPKSLIESAMSGITWLGGAFGTTSYGVVTAPRIGQTVTGTLGHRGTMNYMALIDTSGWSMDYATMSVLSKLLRDGKKPFTGRAL